jgi:hypothetical protein
MRRISIPLFALCPLVASQGAACRELSPGDACAKLIRAAIKYHLSVHDLTGRYYCDQNGGNYQFYIIALRYRTRPEELVGSNLLGWYAVMKGDGSVWSYDINESKTAPLVPGPPFKK